MLDIKLFCLAVTAFAIFSGVNSHQFKFKCTQVCKHYMGGRAYNCNIQSSRGSTSAVVRVVAGKKWRFYIITSGGPHSGGFCDRIAAADKYYDNEKERCPTASFRSNMDEIETTNSSEIQSNRRVEDMRRLLKELNKDSTDVLSNLEGKTSDKDLRSVKELLPDQKKEIINLVLKKLIEYLGNVAWFNNDVTYHQHGQSRPSQSTLSSHSSYPSQFSHPSRPSPFSHPSRPSPFSHPSRPSPFSHLSKPDQYSSQASSSSYPSIPNNPSQSSYYGNPSRPSPFSHLSKPDQYSSQASSSSYPSIPNNPSHSSYYGHPSRPSPPIYSGQASGSNYPSYPSPFSHSSIPSYSSHPTKNNDFSYDSDKSSSKDPEQKYNNNSSFDYNINVSTSNVINVNSNNDKFVTFNDDKNFGSYFAMANRPSSGKREDDSAKVVEIKQLAFKLKEESSQLLDELDNGLQQDSDKKKELFGLLLNHLTRFVDLLNNNKSNKRNNDIKGGDKMDNPYQMTFSAEIEADMQLSNDTNDDSEEVSQSIEKDAPLGEVSEKRQIYYSTFDPRRGQCPLCNVVIKDVCSDASIVTCNNKICCWTTFSRKYCTSDKSAAACYRNVFNILKSIKL